jgi:hypothetical protein
MDEGANGVMVSPDLRFTLRAYVDIAQVEVWGLTDEAKGIDVPVVAAKDDVARAKDDDESGEEFDVLSVQRP